MLSAQSDNVLFAQGRNVLLTRAGWGVGNGPTPDDAEGARPAGCAEESQEKADYPKARSSRDGSQRTAGAAPIAEPKRARRPSRDARCARTTIEPENHRRETQESDRDSEPGSVSRFRTDAGSRVSGEETQAAGK